MERSFNKKGSMIDFEQGQHNTMFTIPMVFSSKQYGFFWNHPGWGVADWTAADTTVWTATSAVQVDFIIMTSSSSFGAATTTSKASPYADISNRYYDAIGTSNKPRTHPLWFSITSREYHERGGAPN